MKISELRQYNYTQNIQIDDKGTGITFKDDNLIENKIFKVDKRNPAQKYQLDDVLNDMKPLFQYGNNLEYKNDRLRYLRFTIGDYEFLSLVLMSIKEKSSLNDVYFSGDKAKVRKPFDLLYNIAQEVNNLHKENIVHGCLKPENIYLDENSIYIANFGLLNIMEKRKDIVNNYSNINTTYISYLNLKGTVYEPPEMRKIKNFTHSSEIEVYKDNGRIHENFHQEDSHLKDADESIRQDDSSPNDMETIDINSNFYTAKMDVYAFGMIFYEVMTRNKLELKNLSIKNGSIFPGDRHFPDAIRALINQCLSINPSDRPSFPQILSAMEKILNNQLNPIENLQHEENRITIDMIKDQPEDIRNLFLKAGKGDIESCLIALQLINKSNSDPRSDLEIEKGTIRIEIGFQNIIKNKLMNGKDNSIPLNDADRFSGKIEVDAYKDISDFVYPKTITVPLISYELTSLSPLKVSDSNTNNNDNNNDNNISSLSHIIKEIALKSNDPNILLYFACIGKGKKSNLPRSPSITRSSSVGLMTHSISTASLNISQSTQTNFTLLREHLLKAARFGSSEALVYLGCIELIENNPNIEKAAYYFKAASDMYNPYGMINIGIMLQSLKTESSYSKAGEYYKLASQSQLKIDGHYKGLELYNIEIENGYVDDEASRKDQYDKPKSRWVDWFLTIPSGRIFLHAPEEFISKSDAMSSYFQSSHKTIPETIKESKESDIGNDLKVAREYGEKIHILYSKQAEFIKEIVNKYQNTTDFPRCPRVLCYGQTCLPVGPMLSEDVEQTQQLNEKMCVHFYCPRCNDFYLPSQLLYKKIPSIYFPREYLNKALKKLYDENFLEGKPFVQYVPTIFGIPMIEVKDDKLKRPAKEEEGTDSAGFFLFKKRKENNLENDEF